MRPAFLAAAVAVALGNTLAMAAPPTAPSDLRVDVYSGTAAELFWSRSSDPDGAVSRYEIRRDGDLVDTRDALSYFTDGLTDGRAFGFTVTAVDFDGERSAPASVSVVGGDRDGAAGAGGGRPPPPANLTSSVYSSDAAEVFWDRSDQPGLIYEVSVDGGQAVTTDGTSAFLSGLGGARGRGVDVVAIDANGQRSGAANVTLGGGSGGGNPNPPPGNGNGDAPAAPSNLRGELYSSNAGEVFWNRIPGAMLSYEVRLGGEAVVATTNGTSYFIDNRPGLSGTAVEVVAVSGPNGRRSSASSVTLGGGASNPTPPPNPAVPGTAGDSLFLPAALASPLLTSIGPGSPLSVANHETFVRAFYDLAEPRVLDTLVRQVELVQAELQAAAGGAASRFVAESVASSGGATGAIVFACPDGGTVRAVFDGDGTSTMDFRQCTLGADTLSGITREAPGGRSDFAPRPGTNRTFGGYRLETRRYPFMDEAAGLGVDGERFTVRTEAGLDTTVFGRVVQSSLAVAGGSLTQRSWRGNWRLNGSGATLLVTDLYADASRYSDDSDEGDRNKAYFVVSGTVTNGRKVTAINQRDFVDFSDTRFDLGLYGEQVFSDAQGGIMDVTAGLDDSTGEQRTQVRIDTDGVILNRALPAELDATLLLR